ncbi:MAG: hypothetical protein WCT20_03735 [Candidatus Babeliales bacterium]
MFKNTFFIVLLICSVVPVQGAFLRWFQQAPKVIEFDEKIFNDCLLSQDYSKLENMTYTLIQVEHKTKILDLIKAGASEKKDPFCLYTYIRNKVLTKKNGTLESDDVALILKNMIISLMLLAGDLACCIALHGDDSILRDLNYACLRNHYAHWYRKHLDQDSIDFKVIRESVIRWVAEETQKMEHTKNDTSNEKIKTEQPSPFWVRYFYEEQIFRRWVIHFRTPTADELQSYKRQANKHQVLAIRLESQNEFVETFNTCNDWQSFFKLGLLKDLNKRILGNDEVNEEKNVLQQAV